MKTKCLRFKIHWLGLKFIKLHILEEKVSELEDTAIKAIQNETQKKLRV
jgi:hypothetical protein